MLLNRLGKELLIFDGGMGSQLQAAGLQGGELPEVLNITQPTLIQSIHEAYLQAGADIITMNTFGCNSLKMKDAPYSLTALLQAALRNAKQAQTQVGRIDDSYVALDIGPIGQLLEPAGTLTFDEAYNLVKEQVVVVKDEVDVVLLETMSDLYEVKAAILAIKENSDLPIFVTMTFEQNKRSLTGTDPLTFVNVVEGLGVDALGVNCSLGPQELQPIIDELLAVATLPILVQPNAGLPILVEGNTQYPLAAEAFCSYMKQFVKQGVALIGGCCGTTPHFIEGLQAFDKQLVKRTVERKTRVSSQVETLTFGHEVLVCGERLNPTGKKKLKQALLDEKYDEVLLEAIQQERAGAHILDVNVGVPGIDEAVVMSKVVKMLQEVINLPLQIDSSSPEAIEQACRYYNGKPLINSVNGKAEVMEAIFPIVKKYGGVVIGLTLDEVIPLYAEERVAIAKKIIATAKQYGIDQKDIVIDCLTLTASAQQKEVKETLKAVTMVKAFGVHTVLGVSNISFGLPNRPLLNRTFLALALGAGLDLPIINPLDSALMDTIGAYNVINYTDVDSECYIRKQTNAMVEKTLQKTDVTTFSLHDIILNGLKDEVEAACQSALTTTEPLVLVNETIIPALNEVGRRYETGSLFLPQLIQSAETTKLAFRMVQACFDGTDSERKGPILMATVEGDIHDIGKNIVKVVLESYGYEVIDLGKNVPIQTVVDAFCKYQPKAIGLSALMTTTVISMKKTIDALKQHDNLCPILVGGAVVNQEIAMDIGADYYCEDAMAAVQTLHTILT